MLEIYLADVGVPNRHGNHTFITRASNSATGRLTRLKMQPQVLVGNTKADEDTVKVEITPAAVYPGEGIEEGTADKEAVDFEITLTASGPMYDSEIQIEVPADLIELNTPQDF